MTASTGRAGDREAGVGDRPVTSDTDERGTAAPELPPTVRCLSAGRGCVNRVPPDVDYCPDCELEGWHNHRGAR
jgi:hypothetical protein